MVNLTTAPLAGPSTIVQIPPLPPLRQPSTFFTGCEFYLTALRDHFSSHTGKERKSFLLYGMGGIGKTQMVTALGLYKRMPSCEQQSWTIMDICIYASHVMAGSQIYFGLMHLLRVLLISDFSKFARQIRYLSRYLLNLLCSGSLKDMTGLWFMIMLTVIKLLKNSYLREIG